MMMQSIMILFTMLHLFVLADSEKPFPNGFQTRMVYYIQQELKYNKAELTSMEALDKVKERYAKNFVKEEISDTKEYFYRLPTNDYYLYYEGLDENELYYMIHLYEFVLDDMDTGMGHYVTYGWYLVHKKTGEIVE